MKGIKMLYAESNVLPFRGGNEVGKFGAVNSPSWEG